MPAGKVEDIHLTPDGQAELTLSIDEKYAPLRQGTLATVRQASLSGVANRYIDLRLPGEREAEIPDGGTIKQESTTTAVDLDEIFNTLDEPTRKDLQRLIKGLDSQHQRPRRADERRPAVPQPVAVGLLAPVPRAERRLQAARALRRLLLPARHRPRRPPRGRLRPGRQPRHHHQRDRLRAAGAGRLRRAAAGLHAPRQHHLPEPARDARRPRAAGRGLQAGRQEAAARSSPSCARWRRDARPTFQDLSELLKQPGEGNDLIDLTNAQVPLRDIAVNDVNENGKDRPGAFPASTEALENATPQVEYIRPYTVDLLGWFDDFSHSGTYDALGAASRVGIHASAFTLLEGQLTPVPPELRDEAFQAAASTDQRNRCPGGGDHKSEDGSRPWKPTPDFNCDPSQTLPGN